MENSFNIIIVNWNTREYLIQCIKSFKENGFDDRDIIVVDQGSTDGSREKLKENYPTIQLISNPTNQGYGQAINIGVSNCAHKYIIACNSDIVIKAMDVGKVESLFEENQDIALLGPKILKPDYSNATRFSRTSILRGSILEVLPKRIRGAWRNVEMKKYGNKNLFNVPFIEGAFFVFRKSAFLSIGGFDTGITYFHEDNDLSLRFNKSGFRVVHYSSVEVVHYGSASFSQVPKTHAYEFHLNLLRYYHRHALRRAIWLKRILRIITKTNYFWLFILKICHRKSNINNDIDCKISRNKAIQKALEDSFSKYSFSLRQTNKNTALQWVTVVIPTRNRPDCISRLLLKLQEQTISRFDVIVVDQNDSSCPCNYSLLNNIDYELKIIYSNLPNRSAAKNIGIKEAKGDIVLFCDDDIIPQDDLIEVHARIHSDQSIGGVSCRIIEDGLPYLKSTHICRITWYGEMHGSYHSDVSCDIDTLVGGNMSIKSHILKEIGYFDAIYAGTSIFEEQDFSSRLTFYGYRIRFSNTTFAEHKPQESGNIRMRYSNPAQYYHNFHHNELIYFLKNRNHLFLIFVIIFCFFRSVRQMIRYKLTLKEGLFLFSGVWMGIKKYYGIM